MGIGEAAILGIVQGLTEFLPVSSSGHLAILKHLFGARTGDDVLSFVVAVHFASLAAIVTVLWRDLVRAFSSEGRLSLLLAVGTVPLLVLGYFLAGPTDALFGWLPAPAIALIGTGAFLMVADRLANEVTELKRADWWDAAIIGLAQVVAMVPGLSRSGLTIAAGLVCGLRRPDAVRFSFLLAVPAILAATAYTMYEAWGQYRAGHALSLEVRPGVIGMVTSYVFSVLAIQVMLKRVGRSRLSYFAWYCWAVSIATLVVWFFRMR